MSTEMKTAALRQRNPSLIKLSQGKILTIKRPIMAGRLLEKPLTLDDIRVALKEEDVEARHISVYKVLGDE